MVLHTTKYNGYCPPPRNLLVRLGHDVSIEIWQNLSYVVVQEVDRNLRQTVMPWNFNHDCMTFFSISVENSPGYPSIREKWSLLLYFCT